MKKILFIIIGFMFTVQTAFASTVIDKMNFETLNKTDSQVLFQDNDMINQQVVLLDKNQMNELKAKGLGRYIRHTYHRVTRHTRHTYHRVNHYVSHHRLNPNCFRYWFSGKNHRRCHIFIKR